MTRSKVKLAGTASVSWHFPDTSPWHCQVDVERTGCAAGEAMTQTSDLDTRHLTPDPEGTGAQQAMVDGSQQVTADSEEVEHESVHG